MAVFSFINSLCPHTLAIINDTASALAVVNTNKNASSMELSISKLHSNCDGRALKSCSLWLNTKLEFSLSSKL